MEEYLEQKYGGKMKFDGVKRPTIGQAPIVHGEAHRISSLRISLSENRKNRKGRIDQRNK